MLLWGWDVVKLVSWLRRSDGMEPKIARIHAFIIHVMIARDCPYQGVNSKVHTDLDYSKNQILHCESFMCTNTMLVTTRVAKQAKVMFSQVFVILSLNRGEVDNTKGQPLPPWLGSEVNHLPPRMGQVIGPSKNGKGHWPHHLPPAVIIQWAGGMHPTEMQSIYCLKVHNVQFK